MITSRSIWAAWRSEPGEEVEMIKKVMAAGAVYTVLVAMALMPFAVLFMTFLKGGAVI